VLQSLPATASFENYLIDVVNRGGDADTTGAIYGREALPARWLKALDPKMREACATQARRLIELRPAL
jgi:ADP-ribosyl-[dinitrogen reductase] hydrolase